MKLSQFPNFQKISRVHKFEKFHGYELSQMTWTLRFRVYKLSQTTKKFAKLRKFVPVKLSTPKVVKSPVMIRFLYFETWHKDECWDGKVDQPPTHNVNLTFCVFTWVRKGSLKGYKHTIVRKLVKSDFEKNYPKFFKGRVDTTIWGSFSAFYSKQL